MACKGTALPILSQDHCSQASFLTSVRSIRDSWGQFDLFKQSLIIGKLEACPVRVQIFLTGMSIGLRSLTTSRLPCFVAGHGKHFAPHSPFNTLFGTTFTSLTLRIPNFIRRRSLVFSKPYRLYSVTKLTFWRRTFFF